MTRRKSSVSGESSDRKGEMEVIDCFVDAVGTHSPYGCPEQSPNHNNDDDSGATDRENFGSPDEHPKYTVIQQFCHMQEQIDDLHMQVVVDREILTRRFNAEISEVENRLRDSSEVRGAEQTKTKTPRDEAEFEEMQSRIAQLEETVQGLVTLLERAAEDRRAESPPHPETAEHREASANNTSSQSSQTDSPSDFSDTGFSSPGQARAKKIGKNRAKKDSKKINAEKNRGKQYQSETATTSETDDDDFSDSAVEEDLRDRDRSASNLKMPKPSSAGGDRIVITNNPFADIPKFESRNPVPTFVDWYKTDFHPAAVEAGLSESEACKKLRSCLGHTAKQAYDLAYKKAGKYSLKRIVANLEVRFSPEEPRDLDELYKRRMQPSAETAEVYAIELETLFDEVCPGVSEDEKQRKLARIFRKGIPQDLLDGCHMFPYPERLDETVRRVKHYEKIWRARTGRVLHNIRAVGFPGLSTKTAWPQDEPEYQIPDYPVYPTGKEYASPPYNTGYDIPAPTVCQICNRLGHDGNDCPLRFTDFPPNPSYYAQRNPIINFKYAGLPWLPQFACAPLPFGDFSRPPPPHGFVPGFH